MESAELKYDNIFNQIKKKSNCPFAKKTNAKIFAWDEKFSQIENLELLSIELLKLICNIKNDNLHGLAVIMSAHYGNSVHKLAETTNTILQYLGNKDPCNCMQTDVETEEWQFRFFGEKFFILTLGTAYLEWHSRYIFGLKATVIFFQTAVSFEMKKICKKTPANKIRNHIRNLFRKAGRPYDDYLIMGKHSVESIDIYKYVKPCGKDDLPMYWWKDKDFKDKR